MTIASPPDKLAEAAKQSKLQKNVFFLAAAKMIKIGHAPDGLLRFKSIANHYDDLGDVYAPDITGSAEREVEKLRGKLAAAQRRARDAEDRLEGENNLASVINEITSAEATPPNWLMDWIPGSESDSVPLIVLTDWHLGEVVNPKTSYGYEYNVAIAEDRARRTVERTIKLTKETMKGLKFPGIVCAIGGDLISGAIHDELAETDELGIIQSVIKAKSLAAEIIKQFADEFGKVFVPCAVGNHGRIFDNRARGKEYTTRNADWLIYMMLVDHFKDDARVVIMAPESGETLFSIYNTNFLLTHGDQIGAKGGDGIIGSIGPIMRGSQKVFKSMASLGITIDHIIMGHYHQSISLPDVTVCGALKGPDEYAMKMLRTRADDPSQMLMLVHPEYGITSRMPIFLRDEWCPDRLRHPD